jgi:hypothetical protein
MTRRMKTGPVGRYDGGYDARVPPGGLGCPVPSPNVQIAVATVPDPYEPAKRIRVAVNRRVDILELERSHGRIGEAAYRVGRVLQAAFERAGGVSAPGWNAGDRVDTTLAPDAGMIRTMDKARHMAALMREVEAAVGSVGARFLRAVLVERQPFAALAARRGRGGERGAAAVAQRFRDLLEDLAEHMAARGNARAPIEAARAAPVAGEAYDERGCLVPDGETGYRVG